MHLPSSHSNSTSTVNGIALSLVPTLSECAFSASTTEQAAIGHPAQDKIGHLSKPEIAQLPDAWRMHL
jgi:hypothetical protein